MVAWAAIILLSMSIAACIYPFGKSGIQSVCRAYPDYYGSWQYAPPGKLDSEHRWVKTCQEAELFHKAYAVIWEQYNTDSTTWCVVCDEIPACPEEFNTCK